MITLDQTLDELRGPLTGYCYRMLGAAAEAEDAVQETMLRAWQRRDTYDPDRGTPRQWTFTLATSVCLDMLRAPQRRARAMDLGPARRPGDPLGEPLPPDRWVTPLPDPQDQVADRDTIRLAFVAALQYLSPGQRAVLVLRDVLGFSAEETAGMLGSTTASVHSSLQRARRALDARRPSATTPYNPLDPDQRALLARYMDAFERHDLDALAGVLRDDVLTSMPPFVFWTEGRADMLTLVGSGSCDGARLLLAPVSANGEATFGQYRPGPDGVLSPFGLVTVELAGGAISHVCTHLGSGDRFGEFGLPLQTG